MGFISVLAAINLWKPLGILPFHPAKCLSNSSLGFKKKEHFWEQQAFFNNPDTENYSLLKSISLSLANFWISSFFKGLMLQWVYKKYWLYNYSKSLKSTENPGINLILSAFNLLIMKFFTEDISLFTYLS